MWTRARDLLLVAVTLLVGCTPKAGGSCKADGKEVCVDEKKALACHDGKWETMTCRGTAGCSKVDGEPVCDQTLAESGDVCNLADDYVCSGDKKSMLQCTKNKWTVVESCLGDRGCTLEKKQVTCDNSIANVGDPCRGDVGTSLAGMAAAAIKNTGVDYACSTDKKVALACQNGHFVQASPCKGPDGCRVTGTKEAGFKVKCDDSIATAGDACEKDDHFSCSADERAILKCRNKKFDVDEKCRSKEKCQIRGGQVGCY